MSDAIKAALEESAWEVCSVREEFRCREICSDCRDKAARVNAGFLEALPDGFSGRVGFKIWITSGLANLAAAVREYRR